MHESQKVASNIYLWSEVALSFIHHFWSVFITSFWLGQINCVWGSLHVLATESCVLDLVLVSFSEAVYLWVTLLFKPKQQCTRRWLTLPRCILNQINKTYTCTCLGYEFCFQQHDNLTRQSYFFKPLSTYLRQNKNPGCYWCFFFWIISFYFFVGNSVNVYFSGDLQYSLCISLKLQYKNLKGCFILKKVSISKITYFEALLNLLEYNCFLMKKKWRFY